MKKIVTSIVLVTLMLLCFALPVFAVDFEDTEKHANKDAIDILSTLQIMNGYNDTTFGPNDTLTRGQACAIMVRTLADASGTKVFKNSIDIFDDVAYDHRFRAEIDTAYRMGIMNGYDNGNFGPEDAVTYDQMFTIVLNTLGYSVNNLNGTWPTNVRNQSIILELTNEVNIQDFSAACPRAHAAQIIVNAFTKNMVTFNGYAFTVASDLFIETLNYKVSAVTTKDGEIGHKYLAFNKNNKAYVTNVKLTTEVVGEFDGETGFVVDKKTINIKGMDIDRYYNGEAVEYFNMLAKGDKATLIYLDDELISIVAWEYDTYIPTKTPASVIKDLKEYQSGISTVTVKDGKTYVSNDFAFGYVKECYTKKDSTIVEFTDGSAYTIKNTVDVAVNSGVIAEKAYMIIFFDYENNIAGYRVICND